MLEFRRYAPSTWMEEGLLTRATREPVTANPRSAQGGGIVATAGAVALTVSLLMSGLAGAGVWGATSSVHPEPPPPSTTSPPEGASAEFNQLVAQWIEDCAFLSSTSTRVAHPAFQRIVGMGEVAIPLLLERLNEPGDWDLALSQITGVDPVPATAHGSHEAAVKAWRGWAKDYGWLDAHGRSSVA